MLKYNDDSAHDYDEMGRYALMSEALKELLIERNVVSAGEVREYLDFMDHAVNMWVRDHRQSVDDPDFKKQLMTDGMLQWQEWVFPWPVQSLSLLKIRT